MIVVCGTETRATIRWSPNAFPFTLNPEGDVTGTCPSRFWSAMFFPRFVSECFKIRLRLHKRAPKTLELPGSWIPVVREFALRGLDVCNHFLHHLFIFKYRIRPCGRGECNKQANRDRGPRRHFKSSNPFACPLNPLTLHSATHCRGEVYRSQCGDASLRATDSLFTNVCL